MLILACPFCGPREFTEFDYGGPAGLDRPPPGATDGAWLDYLYLRANPTGWRRELWRHAHGCGTWFEVERHTTSDEIRNGERPA
jgi:heterotetrameric sarcosine oxidase delta subunit